MLLLAALTAALTIVVSQAARLELETTFSSSAPCTGLYNAQGFAGCTTTRAQQDANKGGELQYFPTRQSLLLWQQEEEEATRLISAIIPHSVWCALSKADLQLLSSSSPRLNNLAIVAEESDNTTLPCLDKLLPALSFPITRLTDLSESRRLVQQAASATRGKPAYFASFPLYMGRAVEMNSSRCLSMGKCDPVGGLSVWGIVHAAEDDAETMQDLILLTANLDARAFFHDLGFGFLQSGADLSIALAVANALASLPPTPMKIGLAFFQGEAMGRIGSKRFVKDLEFAQCTRFSSAKNETCLQPPNYQMQYLKFQGNVTKIRAVVSLQRLLHGPLTLAPSSGGSSSYAGEIQSKLEAELHALGISPASNGTVPATSTLTTFMENADWSVIPNAVGGISLAGSMDDYLGEDEMPAEHIALLNRAEGLANALLRALYALAGGGGVAAVAAVDRDYLKDVLQCFGARSLHVNCSLARHVLNATEDELRGRLERNALGASRGFPNNPLPAFSGIYRPSRVVSNRVKLREELVRNLLANALGDEAQDFLGRTMSCKSDVACRDDADSLLSACAQPSLMGVSFNASRICLAGRCVCSSVSYHDAYSIGIEFNARTAKYVQTSGSQDDLWTEPIWGANIEYTTFTTSNAESVIISLVLGVFLTIVTFSLIRAAQGSAKFKLA